MPGPNPFDDFRFPDPVELEPLPTYEGVDNNYGGYEEFWGGEQGNEPRLLLEADDERAAGEGDLRAFRAYDVQDSAGSYSCFITAGIVVESHIRNQGYVNSCDLGSSGEYNTATRVIIPTIGGVDIVDPQCGSAGSAWSRPRLTLPAPPDPAYIYCHFETDNHGHITGGATIEVYSTEKKSVHYIPPSPDDPDGLTGDYYILLNELCQDTTATTLIKHRFQSNILWQESIIINNESAEGSKVYSRFSCIEDAQMLRRIRGCYGINDAEAEKTIDLEFHATNIGTQVYSDPVTGDLSIAGGGLAEVYVDSGADSCEAPAEFRRITQGLTATQQQVKVTQDGDIIRITGNAKNGKLRWFKCDVSSGERDSATAEFVIEWEDGLIIDNGIYDIIAGCDSANFPGGADGSFTWLDCDSAAQFTISWVNGLIKTSGNHFLKAGCDSSGGTPLTTVTGGYGILASGTPTAVDLDFEGENIGGGAQVYVDSVGVAVDDHPARFRTLAQGATATRQQISVSQDGEVVRITGNAKDGKLRWFKCDVSSGEYDSATAEFVLEWEDGLITREGLHNIRAGCDSANFPGGADGSFTWLDCDSASQFTISWINGLIKTSGNHFLKAGCDSSGGTPLTTVTGGYGILASGTPTAVDLDFEAENVGGGAQIYVDSAGVAVDANPAKFRTLVQSTEAAVPQITPAQVGDTVEVRGNNKTGSLIWRDCDGIDRILLNWEDGLIITTGTQYIVAGCDSSGGLFAGT